jgi:hypothetical protein
LIRPVLLLAFLPLAAWAADGQAGGDATPPAAASPTATPPPAARPDAEAARALVTSIEPRVEAIRGLTFKKPVAVEMADDTSARGHFEDRMRKDWPDSRTHIEQAAYVDLGLLPPRTGLKAAVLDALEEQAAGYYDPGRDAFFVLGDMPASISSFIVAHELTHALDDQYFDIDGMLDKAGADDGRAGGVAAVVEGSGTLVMTIYIVQEIGAGRLTSEAAREYQDSEVGQAKKLKATPQVVQRILIGPYILGMNFLLKGNLSGMPREAAPFGDLERAFRDPPVSWEQVLHPEKYWNADARDLPRSIAIPDLSSTLGDGWSLQGDGSLGELILAILTDPRADEFDPTSYQGPQQWTNAAAAGWGGDLWQLYRRGDDTVTVLATLWDTDQDAREFRAALPRPMRRTAPRHHDAVVVVTGDAGNRAGALAREALRALHP